MISYRCIAPLLTALALSLGLIPPTQASNLKPLPIMANSKRNARTALSSQKGNLVNQVNYRMTAHPKDIIKAVDIASVANVALNVVNNFLGITNPSQPGILPDDAEEIKRLADALFYLNLIDSTSDFYTAEGIPPMDMLRPGLKLKFTPPPGRLIVSLMTLHVIDSGGFYWQLYAGTSIPIYWNDDGVVGKTGQISSDPPPGTAPPVSPLYALTDSTQGSTYYGDSYYTTSSTVAAYWENGTYKFSPVATWYAYNQLPSGCFKRT